MKVLSITIGFAILYISHPEAAEVSSGISLVSIQTDGKPQGVGVIIGPRFVVTTWSLLKKLLNSHSQEQIKLVAGIDTGEPAITRSIKNINYYYDRYEVKRPSSNDVRSIHNIALILVDGEFDSRDNHFVMTAPMVEQGYKPEKGSAVILSGFNDDLKYVKGIMSIVSGEYCASSYKTFNRTYFGEICTKEYYPGQRPCEGDEGLPLFSQEKLAGIVSWLAYCKDPSYPSVFVNIGDYREWIDASMNIMLGVQAEAYPDHYDTSVGQGIFNWVLLDRGEPKSCEMGPKRLTIPYKECYWRCRDHSAGSGTCPEGQCECRSNNGDFFLYNKIKNLPKVDFTDVKCSGGPC